MAGTKALVGLAFTGSIGLLFLFLACALPQFNNWYPITVVVFYLLSPIPSLLAKRYTDTTGENGQCRELAWFLTTGIVVSAFALPIVLSRAPGAGPATNNTQTVDNITGTVDNITGTVDNITGTVDNITETVDKVIAGGACGLVLTANTFMFLTIFGFFFAFDNDDFQY